MQRISFFYRDTGDIASAVAQRGNYFIDAVKKHPAADGYDLMVYCVNSSGHSRDEGVRVKTFRSLAQGNTAGFFARAIDEMFIGLLIGFASIFRRSDLFVISMPPYLSAIIIIFFQILLRRSYAIDIRDMYPRAYLDAGLIRDDGVLHSFFQSINKFIFKRATFIICATRGQRREVSLLGFEDSAITIYNGFPEALLRAERSSTDGFRVVTHGTLGIYQNIDFIIELAESLEQENIEFVVIGHGNKAGAIEQASCKNILYLGELSFDETIEKVASCDVGLCVRDNSPQSRYSFPVKAWEYIGLKMPILIYPRCEVSDVFPKLDGLHTFDKLTLEAFRSSILYFREIKKKNKADLLLQDSAGINAYTREILAEKFANLVIGHINDK